HWPASGAAMRRVRRTSSLPSGISMGPESVTTLKCFLAISATSWTCSGSPSMIILTVIFGCMLIDLLGGAMVYFCLQLFERTNGREQLLPAMGSPVYVSRGGGAQDIDGSL